MNFFSEVFELHSIDLEDKEKAIDVHDLGFAKDYQVVWDFQRKLLSDRIAGKIRNSIVVVEHDHVLTLGRSSHVENVLVKDLPMFEIERGGDVTYHGPGQVVIYPIISLEEKHLGVRQFVELIESAIIDALHEFGITDALGKLGSETGVWIENKRKIASIGVAVSHWVTYHGLALNVNTDLSYFRKIKPCGFESSVMTSLARECKVERVDFEYAKKVLIGFISERLSRREINVQSNNTDPNPQFGRSILKEIQE